MLFGFLFSNFTHFYFQNHKFANYRKVDCNDNDDREQQMLRELKLIHRNQTIITGCSADYSPDLEENPFDFGDAEMCVIGVGLGADDADECGWTLPEQGRWRQAPPAQRPTTLALSGAKHEEDEKEEGKEGAAHVNFVGWT